jgi:flagellar biosynthesis activator protein FlaF
MHQFSYNEILQESGSEARRQEREAFDRIISLLRSAQRKGVGSVEAAQAIFRLRQLWSVLVEDLSSLDNGLPDATKASLISIGIWMMKEAEKVSNGHTEGFETIIAINSIIRDGLQ